MITPAWEEFVAGWFACRDGNGAIGTWPQAGGVWDQAAWVVDAFTFLAGEEARQRKVGEG